MFCLTYCCRDLQDTTIIMFSRRTDSYWKFCSPQLSHSHTSFLEMIMTCVCYLHAEFFKRAMTPQFWTPLLVILGDEDTDLRLEVSAWLHSIFQIIPLWRTSEQKLGLGSETWLSDRERAWVNLVETDRKLAPNWIGNLARPIGNLVSGRKLGRLLGNLLWSETGLG